MTVAAVDALQADRDTLLAVCAGLRDEDWSAPSGCEGWTVKDVVGHVGALFWLVVDQSKLPDASDESPILANMSPTLLWLLASSKRFVESSG